MNGRPSFTTGIATLVAILVSVCSAGSDSPMLVIENGAALWRAECSDSATAVAAKYRDSVLVLFRAKVPVSLSPEGCLRQKIGKGFCMDGECGGDQVAVKLQRRVEGGVLVAQDMLAESVVRTLRHCPRDSLPKAAAEIAVYPTDTAQERENKLYRSADLEIMVQVNGSGHMQENGWPVYTRSQWRLLRQDSSCWEKSRWWNLPAGATTNIPKPIAVLTDKNGAIRVVWLCQVGICCPSASRCYIAELDSLATQGEPKYGVAVEGGFGQPCD